MNEADLRAALQPFLENCPKANLERISLDGPDILAITSPWGDASLALKIPDEPNGLIDALVNVGLPERLSALYHRDTNSLEIIWVAYKLSKSNRDVAGRQFAFVYNGETYNCEFSKASARLLSVASAAYPVGPSETGYRNLPSFIGYARSQEADDERERSIYGAPSSFWIHNISLPEDDLVIFLSHLNFYLSYFDDVSPLVIIHPPQIPKLPSLANTRYRHSAFPKNIVSKAIEPEVLLFWTACQSGEPASRFLYAFRIVEHSAYYYVESTHRTAVRKILMSPHALDNVADATNQIIAALKTARMEDTHRFDKVVMQCVDPSILWEVIAQNIEAFSKPQTFEGGFDLKPLVASIDSKEEFTNSGVKNFCAFVRGIRNALSHGKEERSAAVIAPSKVNQEKLRPWAILMTRAAGEVILYRDA